MRHGPSALRLIALSVAVAATAAAQEEPKTRDLPDAPAAKQDSTPQKHQNPYNTTIEVLGRRSIFFPNIATSVGPLSSYLPVKEQTAGRTFQRYGIRVGLNTASNALREYWPTIFRSLRITKIAPGLRQDPAATTPAATRPSP